MDLERYMELEKDIDIQLTAEEILEGWHFCPDWDFLLVGPGCPELEACTCGKKPKETE